MEFLKTVCFTAALLSLATLLLPKRRGLREAMLTAFGLIFLLSVMRADALSSLPTLLLPETEPPVTEGEAYGEALLAGVTAGIKSDLCAKFSLDPEGLTVDCALSVSEKEARLTRVSLVLGKQNFFADATAMLKYTRAAYGLDCEVSFVGS